MANVLKMAKLQSILSLHAQSWSQRRIARELGVDRGTVAKYLRQRLCGAKPANAPTGSDGSKPATFEVLPGGDPKPANAPIGLAVAASAPPATSTDSTSPFGRGPVSQCAVHGERIAAKAAEGLSARRIHQDLAEEGIEVGYDSVRRFLRRLGKSRQLPYRRLESGPGEEAQVDFGTGAWIVAPDGKRRKSHVFRVVLSHSRKGYSEATFRQTTDDFLGALENAFRHFGGVPQTLVIDNLKAAVAHPDWFDPELVPKVQSFCQHYGTVILPTKPYTPRHKGKIEAGVKYVKNNGLKGRTFTSLAEEQEHLAHWEASVADTRIHGTTKQQVGKLFEAERTALSALPAEPFANFQEARRKVNRDGHVEVAKAYYSVPPEYLARTVWVRWDARLVRIFNHRWEQIAAHVRHEPGRFSTAGEHLAAEKISGLERGAQYWLNQVRWIGPQAYQWAKAMLTVRGIQGTRVLQGLVSLGERHPGPSLDKACEIALSYGAYRLRTLRQLLKQSAPRQKPLPFLDEHPIIRPLDDYARVVAAALERGAAQAPPGHSRRQGFLRHGWAKEDQGQKEVGPARHEAERGPADLLPPRSGYPSSGCSSDHAAHGAQPDSVSPDNPNVVRDSSFPTGDPS